MSKFSQAEKQELRRQKQENQKINEEEKKREQEFYEERINNSRRIQKNKRLELAEAILSGPNPECDFHKDFGDIVNVLKEKRRMNIIIFKKLSTRKIVLIVESRQHA